LPFYDRGIANELSRLEVDYMDASDLIDAETWRRRPFRQRFVENLTRLVSPLL